MPLSPSTSRRALKHTRAIQIQAFACDDGLWDFDAHLADIKIDDARFVSGRRTAESPVRDLSLRLTVRTRFNVIRTEAVLDAVTYPGRCGAVAACGTLAGLNPSSGYRTEVPKQLGGIAGCTHLTELTQVLPTAAVQAFAGEVLDTRDGDHNEDQRQKPFQLDRCHALRSDGAAVARYYPRWAIAASVEAVSS